MIFGKSTLIVLDTICLFRYLVLKLGYLEVQRTDFFGCLLVDLLCFSTLPLGKIELSLLLSLRLEGLLELGLQRCYLCFLKVDSFVLLAVKDHGFVVFALQLHIHASLQL